MSSSSDYDPRVLAFYFVWYGTPWGPSRADDWTGWNGFRHDPDWVRDGAREIPSRFSPLDGLYDSTSEETIRRHVEQAREAGIDGFVIDWWGFEDETDNELQARATERVVEAVPDDFELSIYHELADYGEDDDRDVEQTAVDDFRRILEEYASNPSWMTVDGRPVVFQYGRIMNQVREQGEDLDSWRRIRDRLEDEGYDPFLVCDSLDPAYLDVFDGLHEFATTALLVGGDDLHETYREASEAAHERGGLFAGTPHPGYDDRVLDTRTRDGTGYLLVEREGGDTYADTWEATVEADADWAVINTWNEWYEGTAIEPAREYGYDYVDLTAQHADVFRGE